MTVVYAHEVATGGVGFGNFVKLLFRWRGSIYKLVLPDLILFGLVYYGINIAYRYTLADRLETDWYRVWFHQLVDYCKRATREFPLQFILGFYISQIVTRWWSQFMSIPWPDTVAVITATSVQGHDDRGRLMRRTILRYVNLCLIFTFSMISTQARSRFPTMDHLVDAGLLLPHEKIIIDNLNERLEGPKYYVPVVWAGAIGAKARKEGRIRDDFALTHLLKELCKFRLMSADLLSYDWICTPLVYTQVVTLAVHIYFLACLVGKQMITQNDEMDMYIALFQFLEFFFLMGWLKVGEILINPFGDDDEDFEVNWLIDRNLRVSYIIVDEMNVEFPEMVKDQYWDTVVPEELYYTEVSKKYKTEGYMGSAAKAIAKNNATDLDKENERGASILHMGHHLAHPANKYSNEAVPDKAPLTQLLDRSFIPKKQDSYEDFNSGGSPLDMFAAVLTGRKRSRMKMQND